MLVRVVRAIYRSEPKKSYQETLDGHALRNV
jgi:hypothetical protein